MMSSPSAVCSTRNSELSAQNFSNCLSVSWITGLRCTTISKASCVGGR